MDESKDTVILAIGNTYTGKTTFIHAMQHIGQAVKYPRGEELKKFMQEYKLSPIEPTKEVCKYKIKRENCELTVIDTPGLDTPGAEEVILKTAGKSLIILIFISPRLIEINPAIKRIVDALEPLSVIVVCPNAAHKSYTNNEIIMRELSWVKDKLIYIENIYALIKNCHNRNLFKDFNSALIKNANLYADSTEVAMTLLFRRLCKKK